MTQLRRLSRVPTDAALIWLSSHAPADRRARRTELGRAVPRLGGARVSAEARRAIRGAIDDLQADTRTESALVLGAHQGHATLAWLARGPTLDRERLRAALDTPYLRSVARAAAGCPGEVDGALPEWDASAQPARLRLCPGEGDDEGPTVSVARAGRWSALELGQGEHDLLEAWSSGGVVDPALARHLRAPPGRPLAVWVLRPRPALTLLASLSGRGRRRHAEGGPAIVFVLSRRGDHVSLTGRASRRGWGELSLLVLAFAS